MDQFIAQAVSRLLTAAVQQLTARVGTALPQGALGDIARLVLASAPLQSFLKNLTSIGTLEKAAQQLEQEIAKVLPQIVEHVLGVIGDKLRGYSVQQGVNPAENTWIPGELHHFFTLPQLRAANRLTNDQIDAALGVTDEDRKGWTPPGNTPRAPAPLSSTAAVAKV